MKNLLFISLLVFGLCGCNDDEFEIVHVDLQPSETFSFIPAPGGAVMHYRLPADPEIVGLEVRYNDAYGREMVRAGGIHCDSLLLVGFNEKKENVPARVNLCFYDDRKSQSFDVTFSTEDSGPVTFLKSAEVFPNWGGFSVQYNNPTNAKGMAHVFYLGIDPHSQLPDTILIGSFFLEETDGNKTVDYKIQQDIKDPTIVVRTEDFRGYMVGERVWPDVKTLELGKMDTINFEFFCDRAIVHEKHKLGPEYLFDGDKKGEILGLPENQGKACSFLAGPNSAGKDAVPMYMDLKKNRVIGSIRLYAVYCHEYLGNNGKWNDNWIDGGMNLCDGENTDETPCEVTIYGLKDDGQNAPTFNTINAIKDGWVELGTFKQDKATRRTERWCYPAAESLYPPFKFKEVKDAPEKFIEVIIPAIVQADGYRYVKMVINEVFDKYNDNLQKYVQFHELEIYTAKE